MSQGSERPLRIGIAGLGVGGNNALKDAPGIAAHPHVKLTAAADLRSSALEKFAAQFGGETYVDVEDMCQSSNVDAVYVLTPNRLHAEHAIMAAEHGKQVIIDKPMGLTLEECDAIIRAADKNSVRVLVGHSQSLDAPILKIADMVRSGELGKLLMVTQMNYGTWLYSPRSRDEMDPACGEGIVMRQGPIQVDIARLLGGGLVRSVSAVTSIADQARPVEGSYSAFLALENGASASLTFSGYAHFQSNDLTWGVGVGGRPGDPEASLRARQLIQTFTTPEIEWDYKESERYGGSRARGSSSGVEKHQLWGFTLVSCEKADIRPSREGLMIYGDDGTREITFPPRHYAGVELDEMYRAWINDEALRFHDARWGKSTTEVCLGILESSKLRREVTMKHQTPLPGDGTVPLRG